MNCSEIILMDDDDARDERDFKIINYFQNAAHILNAYQSHQRGEKQLRMSARAMQLALGFHLAAGADGPAELARQCKVSKQALGKCLNYFIEQLKIEPLVCQRKLDARQHMAQARERQIEKNRSRNGDCKVKR